MRAGHAWFSKADDINVRSDGGLERRDGFTRVTTGVYTGAYTTLDHLSMYVVDNGALKRINDDFSTVTLRTGLSADKMQWSEVNNQIFYTNGTDSGIINSDGTVDEWTWEVPTVPALLAISGTLDAGQYRVLCTFVLPDGRETGTNPQSAVIDLPADSAIQISGIPQVAGSTTRVYIAPADSTVFQLAVETNNTAEVWNVPPAFLGQELLTYGMVPLQPRWGVPQYWRGRMFVVEYLPTQNISAIFISESFGFHLFQPDQKALLIPGECTMLAPHQDAMVIGTKTEIHAFDDEKLTKLANYGAVKGKNWVIDDDTNQLYFWTARGVCTAFPFSNLTEANVSVPPGSDAGCSIIRTRGDKRFVVSLQEQGAASNSRFTI